MAGAIRVLLRINPDLASSLALRFVQHLCRHTELQIRLLHIHSPEAPHYATGAGWTRRTWERAVAAQCREDLEPLLRSDLPAYPPEPPLEVAIGDPAKEVLARLRSGAYDLFAQGVSLAEIRPLSPMLQGKLCQQAPVPILLVPVLTGTRRALWVAGSRRDLAALRPPAALMGGFEKIEVFCPLSTTEQVAETAELQDAIAKASLGGGRIQILAPLAAGDKGADYDLLALSGGGDLTAAGGLAELFESPKCPVLYLPGPRQWSSEKPLGLI